MENELLMLNKKIKYILEDRELPTEIKDTVRGIFQEYKALYEEYIQNEVELSNKNVVYRNVDEYFEANATEAMGKITNKYKSKCEDKAEVITIVLSTLEDQKAETKDDKMKKSEMEVLKKCAINDRENYLYMDHITNIVVDSIENSKNQWFRILAGLKTNEQKQEYIYNQIKLIENSAKLKIGNLKPVLELDDKQILDQILGEYEKYEEEQKQGKETEQDAHKKFVSEYRVSEEELQKNAKIAEENEKQVEQNKEYEGLPGNVLE